MSYPLVSVLLPVYNGAAYLRDSIRSILHQTYVNFELIVIDDGSGDGSSSVVSEFEDRRVRFYAQRNRGLSYTLNRAIRLSKGQYLARQDQDDIAFVDRLETQVSFLNRHPNVAVLGGAMTCIDERGEPIGFVFRYPTHDKAIKKTLLSGSSLAHPTVMMRRDAIRAVNGYRKAFLHAEDYDLWLRTAEHFELANLPDILLRYRIHKHQDRVLEQQAMSTLAAQVSAKLRRRTGLDPMDRAELITRDFLIQLGVSDLKLRWVLLQTYILWASLMLQSSNVDKAEKLLGLAGGLDPDSPFSFGLTYGYFCGSKTTCQLNSTFESALLSLRKIRKDVLGSFRLGWALALWKNGRPLEATNEAISACALEPALALKLIRWGFHHLYYKYFS